MKFVWCIALLLAGCGVDRSKLTIHVSEGDVAVIEAFREPIPFDIKVVRSKDPAADAKAARGDGINVGLVQDLEVSGAYRVEGKDERYVVHGGGVLGIQHGLAELLEAYGFRFFHPYKTRVPEKLDLVSEEELNKDHAPQMSVRGLHLHILHPIEAYYDFWEPSEGNRKNALRVIDWMVKNRGNYVQWTALDDIQRTPEALAAWQEHTRAILDEGHRRGVRFGIGLQLFGASNLQKAFDLIETKDDPADPRAHIKARLRPLLDLEFDHLSLSFGEFSGVGPERFIARVNDVYDMAQELRPGIDMSGTIHVGEDVTITYQGETFIYYFLVKYTNPAIIHWVHTVMFYNLYEDAGGAYHHNNFRAHRDHLLDQLSKNRRVAYHPESAYWVAFDNPIPTWLPLYVKSRWLDMSELRKTTEARGIKSLDEHALFSTGWEWGYWQQDVATLRLNYKVTERFEDVAEWMFKPYGEAGKKLADAINDTARVQNELLIGKRLTAYFASRDGLMDAGRGLGIISQPDRPTFDSISKLPAAERDAFETNVVAQLGRFSEESDRLLTLIEGTGMPAEDRWHKEMVDGATINALRARFIRAAWTAPVKKNKGEDAAGEIAEMKSLIAQAKTIVERRRENMHDPEFRRLIRGGENATVYPYGYLREADRLCFWNRELVEVDAVVNGGVPPVPPCVDVDLQ